MPYFRCQDSVDGETEGSLCDAKIYEIEVEREKKLFKHKILSKIMMINDHIESMYRESMTERYSLASVDGPPSLDFSLLDISSLEDMAGVCTLEDLAQDLQAAREKLQMLCQPEDVSNIDKV